MGERRAEGMDYFSSSIVWWICVHLPELVATLLLRIQPLWPLPRALIGACI